MVIYYRRHDEKVNAFVSVHYASIKGKIIGKAAEIKEKSKQRAETGKTAEEKTTPETSDKKAVEKPEEIPEAKEEKTEDDFDDEDLSSIDLDEAIAAFDDSI